MRSAPAPQIEGLTFVRILGSGGFADVFLYDQANPARKVAVKVLRETGLSHSAVQSFAAEANAMARLEHPYIVPVYATGTTKDHRPFIVMMYYPKPSLAERARAERFAVAETLRLGIQLGSAIETAHRAGLLHRDIKPANVLTSAYDKPGLADFGIAGQMSEVDDKDLGVSVPWSPPETLYATAPGTVRSDVYSLAATLWHLLVGRSPFEVPGGDNSPFAIMKRVRDNPVPPTGRADAPASLDRLLQAAMGKEAGLRPASALEFIGALQAIEQELRLPRTQLELAAESVDRHTAGGRIPEDRTQVKPRVVVSPVSSPALPSTGPGVTPGSAAAAPGGEASEARRGGARPTPIGGFAEEVQGATVLRGAPGGEAAPELALEREPPRRWWIGALAALLLVAVIGVGAALASGQQPTRAAPAVTLTEEPPAVGDVALPPGTLTITPVRSRRTVTFRWTYPNPLDGDVFEWRIAGASGAPTTTDQATAVIASADGGKVCIEVKVFRSDGGYAPPSWTSKCAD